MAELSPAVERAAEAAKAAGGGTPTLAHWLRVLLEDDEGRPAVLLEQAGVSLAEVREALQEDSSPAPDAAELFRHARELGLHLRADPAVTTDLLFLALLLANDTYTPAGLSGAALLPLLRTATTEPGPAFAPSADFHIPDPPEQLLAARAVDANLNRAREALRVLDDFARFTQNDKHQTERIKSLRHRLAEASESLPKGLLLAARDTANDVGTAIRTAREYTRTTPADVAAVNLKRLQEALRSAEEFGKVIDAGFAASVEAIRYEAYTLEREVIRGGHARAKLADAKLYVLLSGARSKLALDFTIEQASLGGADVIQLREKGLPDRELIERATKVRAWTRRAGVLMVVNDRPDIAQLVDADGVHLGQDDLPVSAARRIVGADALIGVSTHTVEQVRQAIRDGADYLGVGPTFPSGTKSFDTLAGLAFVREAFAETTLPAFALGGITAANVGEVAAAGANRVAVSGAIANADDPRSAAVALRRAFG